MNKKTVDQDKEFDTVTFFRDVKEKIAKETRGMSFSEFKKLLDQRKVKLTR
jgi:hypothetical protein